MSSKAACANSAAAFRLTAQLVEAETGKHVWAERFDRDLADIFALQDEITEAVTIAIAPAIADAEQHRAMRKPPGSLDASAAYHRGLWHLSKATSDDISTIAHRSPIGGKPDPQRSMRIPRPTARSSECLRATQKSMETFSWEITTRCSIGVAVSSPFAGSTRRDQAAEAGD
jgi:hypothetical protein